MSSVGEIIKTARVNMEIKQAFLAKGICSTSYLSKIENNLTIPNQEIVNNLLRKLNIVLKEVSSEEESKIISSISNLYKESVVKKDYFKIKEYLDDYNVYSINFNQQSNFYYFLIYSFRLLLLVRADKKKIENLVINLKNFMNNFNLKQKFLFHLNLGLYYHLEGYNEEAITNLEKSLKLTYQIALGNTEKIDLYNALSLSYLENEDYLNTIYYSSKALVFFKDNFLFEKTIDCYLVIGIAQKNLLDYKKAEDNYNSAYKLSSELKLVNYEALVYQNLGHLHAIQKNSEQAMTYYRLSLEIKEKIGDLEGSLVTIFSIVKEHSKLNNLGQVLQWCREGLHKIKDNNTHFYQSFKYHFHIYASLCDKKYDIEVILKNAIKYFESKNDYRHVRKYSFVMAEHCYKMKKFKNSSDYFIKAFNILLVQKNIENWEDL